ncbi:putative ribonuclease H-like domain-containing protein [Tanacetum coccineum]
MGHSHVSITTDSKVNQVLPPEGTAEEILAEIRKKISKDTLLMACTKFGGNDESKKMQKYIIKQQFEGFSVSNSEGLQKATMDRSLPSAWSQVSLIMRTKPGVDSLSFDDLYNNLRVFENDVKGSTASSSSTQNVAFVSENTSSTNDVSTAYGVSNLSGQNSQYEHTSSYSLLANQSSCPQLDHEDLEQLDEFDLEEMDLKWQVAMISMRMKKFYKKTGRKLQFDAKEPVGFDKTKVECYNCHKTGHFARECRTKGNQDSRRRDAWNSGNKDGRRSSKQEDTKALVTIDGEGSDTEVSLLVLRTVESYAKLKKLYDEQRAQLSDASIEIQAYTQGLKKVEAQLVAHQQGQLWLGYGDHRYYGILSYENEVLQSVFMSKESDFENQSLYDRFVTAGGMHAVPPPLIGNYMLSGPDIEIDYSQFMYGPKQSQPSEFETQTSEFDTCESNISTETPELVSEPVVNEPNVVCQPKVWFDAPIIEEYEIYSEDEHVSLPKEKQETPSFANQQVKTTREIVKNIFTHNKNPKVDKKGMGYGFTTRACFVCGSLSHLIRDCDFHEKRMAKQAELNNRIRKKSSQREIKPIWNNVQRMNHKNQFVPSTVLTKTGTIPVSTVRASGTNNVSTARYNFNKQAVPTNAAMKVNTVKPNVKRDYPHKALQNKGIVDSGCSRHMTGNKAYLAEYQDFNGGPVAFGGSKDEGFLVGYSLQSKAFRVYNLETKRVEENLHITFLENKPNVAGKGPTWLFDLDYLTDSMNYQPVRLENQANKHASPKEDNHNAGTEDINDAGDSEKEDESAQVYFVLPVWSSYSLTVKRSTDEAPTKHHDLKTDEKPDLLLQAGAAKTSSTNIVNTASTPVSTVSPYGRLSFTDLTNPDQDDSEISALEEIYDNPTDGIFTNSSYDDEGAVVDFMNLEPVVNVSYIQKKRRNNHKDFQHCLFACFLSQNKPKKISEALEDESWVDAMQEELLQFKIQKVYILVDLPYGKKAIGTK